MFAFFENIYYLLFLLIILFVSFVVAKNTWSKGVLSKEPKALIRNNSLIISGVVLIIAVFIIFSWLAGIITIVLASIFFILIGRKKMRGIENNILDSYKKEPKE